MSAAVTLDTLEVKLRGLAGPIPVSAFDPVWPGVAQMAVSDVRKNFQEGHGPDGRAWLPLAHGRPGQPGGAKPLRDRGLLMASITGRAVGPGITVGTNLVSAAVHQYGATIVPRRSKFLAIPLTVKAKRAGSPRRYRGQLSPRISRAGTGVLVDDKTDQAQYALVLSVRIPARPFLGFSLPFLGRVERLLTDRALQVINERLEGGLPGFRFVG